MTLHKDLTGASLHEPKGVATASSGQVYQADGAGSGVWTTLTIPTGLFNITTAEFTSSGTWTKPANCFMLKVTVVGGGGTNASTPGGTSSFGSYVSATGGNTGTSINGGTGSGGDSNYTGDEANTTTIAPKPGLYFGTAYGLGSPGDGTSTAGGAGGGAAVKYIYSVPSSATVTVGAAGAGGLGAKPGYVLVEQYIPV